MENGAERKSKPKIVTIAENQNTEEDSSRVWRCRNIIMSFYLFFPLGLLAFILFWTGILLKLYLPST